MTIRSLARPFLLGALFVAGSADAARLLPPAAGDVVPSTLLALPAPDGEFERAPVQVAWALDPLAELAAPVPHVAESREYWFVVDAADLKRGVDVQTTAPGAVIRLSPADGRPLDPSAVRLEKSGVAIAAPLAFAQRHDAAAMRAAGLDVPDGSAVVRIAAGHGAGTFRLAAPATGRTLVHVYEPASAYVLLAQADATGVLAGDRLEVAARLQRGITKLAGGTLHGDLVSPFGQRFPLAFRDGRATIVVPVGVDTGPGLWEIALYAGHVDGGVAVQREARTVVQVSRPTARLTGEAAFDAGMRALRLPLQVASPGRYEVRGTLYATASDGVARPVALAHSAAWFGAGRGELRLAFAGAALPPGYGAPFEVRDLALHDQTRMGRLETRAIAVRGSAPRAPTPPRVVPRDRLARR